MSEVFYETIIRTDGMKSERVEMTVDIYESADTVRDHDLKTDINTQQPLQLTGSEHARVRSYRSVTVCLVVLCVLLLTAVIVLCVLINTNNQQWHNKTKNLTEEKDKLKAKYNNTTKREQLNLNDVLKYLQDGWIIYQFSLYFISSEEKSWSESRRYCREKGADLIIINNKEEQDFVKKISKSDNIWIGLSDSDEEGRWKWVDASPLTSRFWGSAEPDGKREENCALSYISRWYDYPCSYTYKWICEKRLIK